MKPYTKTQQEYLELQATSTNEDLRDILDQSEREGRWWLIAAGVFIAVGAIAFLGW